MLPENLVRLYAQYRTTSISLPNATVKRVTFKSYSSPHFIYKAKHLVYLGVISFHFSFTGQVKLKGIMVIGGEDDSHPSEVKLYVATIVY